jgi:hypothetical protein
VTGIPSMNGFYGSGSPGPISRREQREVAVSWLIEALADALAPRLLDHLQVDGPSDDGWMDSSEAAEYLALTKNALHKLTSARAIPFEQEGRGCKLWFRRPDLDAWRRGEGGRH